jgi:hypothetical protein
MAQLENIEAIEKRLWSAVDNLRANSNYASNEYFMPVMGLIFLRHAYSRYLGVKDGIEASLPKRGGKTRPLSKASLLRSFLELVTPFHEQMEKLNEMNQELRATRDLLLPRLMGGEIAV